MQMPIQKTLIVNIFALPFDLYIVDIIQDKLGHDFRNKRMPALSFM
jgi:hypothetical protein